MHQTDVFDGINVICAIAESLNGSTRNLESRARDSEQIPCVSYTRECDKIILCKTPISDVIPVAADEDAKENLNEKAARDEHLVKAAPEQSIMKTTEVLKDGLGVAVLLLRLTSAAADVFPPLKSAAGGALFILDTATQFSSNKQQWADLAEYVTAAIACVIESLPKSKEPRQDLRVSIEKLADAMHHIEREIRSIRQQSGFARALTFGKYPDKILGMRKELDDALSLFHLKTALTTGLDVAKVLDGVNIEELVERVNSKLSDKIVSAINLNGIPCAEGASWDPNPSNTCLPNTRVELLKDIMGWIESPDHESASPIMWLSSVAGGGKTALANTVAKLCHEKRLLAASFFFDRKTAGRNEPKRLFSTLARGLANYSTEVAIEINRAIEDDQSVPTSPIFRQFEELIRVPSLRYSGSKPITFVVDALDEGLTTALLQLLRDEFPKLPNVFRVFVTSRTEPQIVAFLANKPHIRRISIEIQSQSNADDISLYAEHELREVAARQSLPMDWPGVALLKEFITKAGGLFIWVSVVTRYLCGISYPEKKLAALLSKNSNQTLTAEDQMDDIYSSILESCNWKDADFVEGYHLVMGAITALRTPLSISALQSLHRPSPIRVEEILKPIGSLIVSDLSNATQPVQFLHLSLQEFLSSRAQLSPLSTKFYLGHTEHSQRLAYLCLVILNSDLHLHIPGTGFLQRDTPESKLPGIPDLNAADIPEVLWYACQFWMDHLMEVEAPNETLLLELNKILTTQLTRWLEILTGRGQFQNLERLSEWLHRTTCNSTTAPVVIPESDTATLYHVLSDRLAYMDRREDALSAIEQTVTLRRQKGTDRPALAHSIRAFSICLSNLGRREDALEAAEQAVVLSRQLAADSPTTFNPDLAMSLNNISLRLSDLGRQEEALGTVQQALVLYRQLATDHPATFNPNLAGTLENVSFYLSHLGRREEALDAIEQSVTLHRQLAADSPATYKPALAEHLNNFSRCLSDLGRREEALDAVEQAVALFRQLAADLPATFNPNLAGSLNTLSLRLSDLRRREEALDAIEESVALRRQLANDRPAIFNPDLAESLNTLSLRLYDLRRREEALDAIDESIALRRQLANDRPATFKHDLAESLNTLSLCLSNLGRREDALDAIEQSVALYRPLAADLPAAFNCKLAMSLHSLSSRLSDVGRPEDALEAIKQALLLRRQLAKERPAVFNADLIDSLNQLSTCLTNLGRAEEAHQATREAESLTL